MPVLTATLPLPIPVTSASSDETFDTERIVSSLSTSYSMASALSTTATDTSTVLSHSQLGERKEEKGEGEGEGEGIGDGGSLVSPSGSPLSSAKPSTPLVGQTQTQITDGLGDFASPSSSTSGSFRHSQIIDFTAKSSSFHNPPYTPTSTSVSMSLPMPSPKSDVDGTSTRNNNGNNGRMGTTTKQQHRKSISVGGVISSITTVSSTNVSNNDTTTTTAKVQTFTQPQRRSRGGSVQLRGRSDIMGALSEEKEKSTVALLEGFSLFPHQKPPQRPVQQLLVNTPPEMLPPSPPLTNNELEMDEDEDHGSGGGGDDESSGRDRNRDDADVVGDTERHARSHSQSQTETSEAQEEDDEEDGDGDVDGVNPQIEADIAHGWQAPDSKLETTPGTPVLPSQSPSTTSLPSQSRIQESNGNFALSISSPLSSLPSTTLNNNDNHPLSLIPPSSPSLSKVRIHLPSDVDLEKGDHQADHVDDSSVVVENAKRRASIEPAERADTPGALGVTKTFEVVRPAKRYSSPQPPRSSYYIGPPTGPTVYGTAPTGQIGLHHPREIVRIERDYDHGELVQFSSAYPLEFEGRITPTQFLETINAINECLIRAHSLSGAFIYNLLAILTFWISPFFIQSTYKREMRNLQVLVDALNAELYNPQGLNILWPRRNAFLFLEIEYY